MFYADNFCIYTERYDEGGHVYIFSGKCSECRENQSVTIPGKALYEYRQGQYIQTALAMLSPAQREFLMTGICGKCFDRLFSEE